MKNLQDVHGSASLTPFPSLLSKKDELWRNIESMRVNKNQVDLWWLGKVDEMVDRDKDFGDFLPDTLILPEDMEKWAIIKPGL